MDNDNTVKIVNELQAKMYIKNGLKPVEVFWGYDTWVFVFDKQASKPYFDKWCKHELN